MKSRPGRNYQEEKEQGPDCCTCIHRNGCERYAEKMTRAVGADLLHIFLITYIGQK